MSSVVPDSKILAHDSARPGTNIFHSQKDQKGPGFDASQPIVIVESVAGEVPRPAQVADPACEELVKTMNACFTHMCRLFGLGISWAQAGL